MKKILISLAVITWFSFLPNRTSAQVADNCTPTASNPYTSICSDRTVYDRGDPISFTLSKSRVPLFIGPLERPWVIEDEDGKTIFEPVSILPTVQPIYTFSFTDSWDQKDMRGKQVKKGTYYLRFNANVPPLKIEISNKTKS